MIPGVDVFSADDRRSEPMMTSSGGQLMETTLMTISLTDIEDSEESSGPGQLMVDMECPNCKVAENPVIIMYV